MNGVDPNEFDPVCPHFVPTSMDCPDCSHQEVLAGQKETIFMDATDVVRRQIRGLQAIIGHLGHARILLEDMEHPSLGDIETLMQRLQGECAVAVQEMQRRGLK